MSLSLKKSLSRYFSASNAFLKSPLVPEDFLFDQQLKAFNDSSKRKMIMGGRRAGKTELLAFSLFDAALRFPKSLTVYLGKDKSTARDIIAPKCRRYEKITGASYLESEFKYRLPSGSEIWIKSWSERQEVEKLLGSSYARVIIDEAQAVKSSLLEFLVKSVASPALLDQNGDLWLCGTMYHNAVGYYYEEWNAVDSIFSKHRWTVKENVILQKMVKKTGDEILEEVRKENKFSKDDPIYLREYLCEWKVDALSLVYRVRRENFFEGIDTVCRVRVNEKTFLEESYEILQTKEGEDVRTLAIGIDVGFKDKDAYAILGLSTSGKIYLLEEYQKEKSDVVELSENIRRLFDAYRKKAEVIHLVMDEGALGKKIAQTLRLRSYLPILPAEKSRKLEFIEILNADLRHGRFFLKEDSIFARDSALLKYTVNAEGERVISTEYHSDICDAVLYAWRRLRGH